MGYVFVKQIWEQMQQAANTGRLDAKTAAIVKTIPAPPKPKSDSIVNAIAVIAVSAIIGPEVSAITGGGAAGAAATSAISSAAITAANGGNVGDIATAAIAAGAGGYAGQAAGTAVGAPISGTELTTLGKIAASATGASTSTTLRALADGSSLSDALTAGAKSGVAAGITSGGIEGLKAFVEPSTGPAPVEERGVATSEGAIDTQTAGQTFPISDKVTQPTTLADPVIGKTEERLLASALYPAVYSTLFGKQQQAPISATPTTTTTQAPPKPVSPVQTTAAPGTQALAQALRVGDVGAPIFGGDKEEGKKAGWNVESLRYMGNSEA